MRRLELAALAVGLSVSGCSIQQKGEEANAQNSKGAVYHASELPYPFSDAVEVDGVLYLSGDIGANDAGTGVVPGGIEAETRRIFQRMEARLAKHDLAFDDVFKCTVMLEDMSEWPAFNAIYAEYFKEGRYPARSAFGTNGLALGAKVELECWAAKG